MQQSKHTPFSAEIPGRFPLGTVNNGAAFTNANENNLTSSFGGFFPWLLSLEAVCTVVGTTGAIFTLRDAPAGTTLVALQTPMAPTPLGTRYVWQFPHPWRGAVKGQAFTLQASNATYGTFVFFANGFFSSL